ncbi:MAG: L-seryl-tRNA(Sec) selenium transferase [Desulfobacterales bacterium]
MPDSKNRQTLLRKLPGVDRVMSRAEHDAGFAGIPRRLLTDAVRRVVDDLRSALIDGEAGVTAKDLSESAVLHTAAAMAREAMKPNLRRVVNGTGVVVHTNLGRSLLAEAAIDNVRRIAGRYSNLEYDLKAGKRGSRYSAVEGILSELSGSEAGMVVNNNAAAVLLCLDTLAHGREVVVSRGELVEIGGSFRIPDVMAKSGARLREVGTTNRTHLRDYEQAIGSDTALLLKVHQSNFSIVGFTKAVSLSEMVALGRSAGIPVMEDLGSGTFVDFSRYGLSKEPTVQESVAAGADVVTFSGDKLLGGPQAGLIVGRRDILERIRLNPLTRALRIDKMTLAALEATLRLYRDEPRAVSEIPTLAMITMDTAVLEHRAARLAELLRDAGGGSWEVQLTRGVSKTGGGALPLMDLPSRCLAVAIPGMSANALEAALRAFDPPIIGRIADDRFTIDVRTLTEADFSILDTAFRQLG